MLTITAPVTTYASPSATSPSTCKDSFAAVDSLSGVQVIFIFSPSVTKSPCFKSTLVARSNVVSTSCPKPRYEIELTGNVLASKESSTAVGSFKMKLPSSRKATLSPTLNDATRKCSLGNARNVTLIPCSSCSVFSPAIRSSSLP